MKLERARNILAAKAVKEAELKEAIRLVAEAEESDDSKEPIDESIK